MFFQLPYKGTTNVLSCPKKVQRMGKVVQTRDVQSARILSIAFSADALCFGRAYLAFLVLNTQKHICLTKCLTVFEFRLFGCPYEYDDGLSQPENMNETFTFRLMVMRQSRYVEDGNFFTHHAQSLMY